MKLEGLHGCNLVERNSSNVILWQTGTSGSGCHLAMQVDGNLVLYDLGGVVLWASHTGGCGTSPYRVAMQSDGNVVVYGGNQAIWSSRGFHC